MYFGLELEYEASGDRLDIVEQVTDIPWIYCKEDFSLDNGIEFVSHPCTYQFHKENLSKLIDTLNYTPLYAEDTCGLHIHMSKDALGSNNNIIDKNISKLIYLMDKYYDTVIAPISNRDSEKLEGWADNYKSESASYVNISEIDHNLTVGEALINGYLHLTKNSQTHGRNYAVNISGQDTIEFRLFASTLNTSEILGAIEFVMVLVDLVISNTDKELIKIDLVNILKHTNYENLKGIVGRI